MRRMAELVAWLVLGLVGAALLAWAFPRAYPFYPDDWTVNRHEAEERAVEAFRALGEPMGDGMVVTHLYTRPQVERRLYEALPEVGEEALESSLLGDELVSWGVTAYPAGARPNEWRYHATVSHHGRLTRLMLQVPPEEELPDLDPAEARRRADAFLAERGFDLADYGEPELRRVEEQRRAQQILRYPAREAVLGDAMPYGLEVRFDGDVLTGFRSWRDDPEQSAVLASFRPASLLGLVRLGAPFLIFPLVAVFFLRRYHAGEVGVGRAVQVFLLSFGAGVLMMVLAGAAPSEDSNFGLLSRVQVAWVTSFFVVAFWIAALALVAALSWSVGEALARSRWPHKLAAFDALFQGSLGNSTVARAWLRGTAAGLALAGGLTLLLDLLPGDHGEPMLGSLLGPNWQHAALPGVALACFLVIVVLYGELFGRLFLLSGLVARLGRWGSGALVVVLSAALFWPLVGSSTATSDLLLSGAGAVVLVALFLAYDLLTPLLAAFTALAATHALPLLLADDAYLQLQGAVPLALVAVPLLLTARHLVSREEFEYRWEDVPPHVRRIAERERQRVELETARRIQSSILPELPPSLHGVELAHAYLPASEVGGDFYDVLALEDGRLAVAVGDVAGHGVSSGLVMSMTRSALAVQVTFDPDVRSVFRTLNRTVYQSARKRLLATLCYALVDPVEHRMTFASAGHLFPYRIGRGGGVEALESVSYPLGVRESVEMFPKEARLDAGDTLFLFSDGIVEARYRGSDDQFGFERLEAALRHNARGTVAELRDGVLAAVDDFTGPGPREDDQTVLVLRLP